MKKVTRMADIVVTRDNTESRQVEGLAAVFNQDADLGMFVERIDSRAFENCDMSDVVLNFNHNNDYVLARTTNGSLKLEVREDGLHQSGSIANTTQGNDVLELVKEGLIDKMSFAFTVDDDKWETKDGVDHRTITSIGKLYDVSLVTFPAYPQTNAGLRSKDEMDDLAKEYFRKKEQERKLEEILNGKNFK